MFASQIEPGQTLITKLAIDTLQLGESSSWRIAMWVIFRLWNPGPFACDIQPFQVFLTFTISGECHIVPCFCWSDVRKPATAKGMDNTLVNQMRLSEDPYRHSIHSRRIRMPGTDYDIITAESPTI
jgi:hypothetical protein